MNRLNQFESLLLPVVLLMTGLILLGGDRVGLLSLDRIENLWPVAFILVGLSDLLTSSDTETAQAKTAGTTRVSASRR